MNMQMIVASLLGREGFALLMFLTLRPILGISCVLFPPLTAIGRAQPTVTWAKPASLCASWECPGPRRPRWRTYVSGRGSPCTFRVCPFLALLACWDKCLCPRGCLPVWAPFVASHGPPWSWIVNSGHHIKHAICTPVGSRTEHKKDLFQEYELMFIDMLGLAFKTQWKTVSKAIWVPRNRSLKKNALGAWRKPLCPGRCPKLVCPHQSPSPRTVRCREVSLQVSGKAGPKGRGGLQLSWFGGLEFPLNPFNNFLKTGG